VLITVALLAGTWVTELRQARDLGATIALTEGRPLTSGRILVKAKFKMHSLENCYRLTTD
jgi:hypothetical protein